MKTVLCIETSGPHCSVCLANDSAILAHRVAEGVNQHSTVLHDYIEAVLLEAEIEKSQLSAIAYSSGPGSYTGLRIGLSAAKGLAYALDIPILEVSTLKSLANETKSRASVKQKVDKDAVFVPMIDAGRMEVYFAAYNETLAEVKVPGSGILDELFFDEIPNSSDKPHIYFSGNGSTKGATFQRKDTVTWVEGIECNARLMVPLALEMMKQNQYADLAYCLPTYVKRYIPGKSKK